MPDTGAPWNIPYVASTDLVSDWPTDSLALANAIDAGLDSVLADITIPQVISAASTSTFTTTSATDVLITDVEVDITPASASNKVLVIMNLPNVALSATGNIRGRIYRDGTAVFVDGREETYTATAGGGFVCVFLDSPATTSAVNYEARVRRGGGSGTVSVFGASITALEVAA